MSGWLAIGLVAVGLVAVALIILAMDVARGDVGGGRHTLARARRLLVVATDDVTLRGADRWIDEQRRQRPELQCFVLCDPEGQDLFMDIQHAIARESPDAIVMVRHQEEHHAEHAGTFGRLKDELTVPVDAVFVSKEGALV